MSVSNYSLMLTAVDFSAESETLIDRAAQFRAQCGARLCLLHVVEYLPMAYSGDLVLPEGFDLEQELLEVASRQMAALGERLGVAEKDQRVEIGNTGHTILRVAEDLGADIILVGRAWRPCWARRRAAFSMVPAAMCWRCGCRGAEGLHSRAVALPYLGHVALLVKVGIPPPRIFAVIA